MWTGEGGRSEYRSSGRGSGMGEGGSAGQWRGGGMGGSGSYGGSGGYGGQRGSSYGGGEAGYGYGRGYGRGGSMGLGRMGERSGSYGAAHRAVAMSAARHGPAAKAGAAMDATKAGAAIPAKVTRARWLYRPRLYRPRLWRPGSRLRPRRSDDRGFIERASDEVASWFGDEDAERRRRMDEQGEHRGRGPKGYARSDDRIREEICDRLTDDPMIDASEVEVTVSSGEVTLAGTVDRREIRRRAEDLAERISGVNHVQNNLRVRQSCIPRWAEPSRACPAAELDGGTSSTGSTGSSGSIFGSSSSNGSGRGSSTGIDWRQLHRNGGRHRSPRAPKASADPDPLSGHLNVAGAVPR